jgi:hypothetical protein
MALGLAEIAKEYHIKDLSSPSPLLWVMMNRETHHRCRVSGTMLSADSIAKQELNPTFQRRTDIDCIYKRRKWTILGRNCRCDALSPIDADNDILQWWKLNSKLFPNLSKMAQELLAIPGTAVPSERVNSQAREMLPYSRSRLSPEKIEATLVLKSYLSGTGPGVKLLNNP